VRDVIMESETESIEEKAKTAIAQLWVRYRPAILNRLSVVEAADGDGELSLFPIG